MAKTSRRKLFLFGRYSLAILPPKKWLSELGVKQGDTVTIQLDRAKRRLVIQLDNSAPPDGSPASTASRSKKPEKGDGWEPIPQL